MNFGPPRAMYLRPSTLSEACEALAQRPAQILSGGTDVYPALVDRPAPDAVLDISGLHELRGISHRDGEIRIGARTTWSDLASAELPPAFDALKAAARESGRSRFRMSRPVAGNLCNASPAADGVPASSRPRCAGRAREPLRHPAPAARRFSPGKPAYRPAGGRDPVGDHRASDERLGPVLLREARDAAIPRDLDRHGGGAARRRRARADSGRRRGGRGLLGGAVRLAALETDLSGSTPSSA
jgi:hypothetical protein